MADRHGKAEKLGKVSSDEINSIKYVPEGNRIASQYLQDDKSDLMAEMAKFPAGDSAKYVNRESTEILLRNISLRTTKRTCGGPTGHGWPAADKGKQEAARVILG